jgi:hypothetical protein
LLLPLKGVQSAPKSNRAAHHSSTWIHPQASPRKNTHEGIAPSNRPADKLLCMELIKKLFSTPQGNDFIIVVSGLPRSGTSMMMQMLEAAGLQIVSDNLRQADKDNPRGYFEDERVKKLKENSSWLAQCRGKVLKVISLLLFDLPLDQRYRVIFMDREIKEVLASQKVMLERRGEKPDQVSDEVLAAKFTKHLHQVKEWMAAQAHIEVLYVNHRDVLADPRRQAEQVCRFLDLSPQVETIAEVVERSLYRQREG